MKRALVVLSILAVPFVPDSCFGQGTMFPAIVPSSTPPADTNLDFVSDSTAQANDATQLDVVLNIPSGHTNKVLVLEVGGYNYGTVTFSTIQRTGTSTNLTEVATESDMSALKSSIRYLLDADLPSSGDVTVRITTSTSTDIAARLSLYNGALQTSGVATNSATYDNCGWYTSEVTVDGSALGWTWTNNACTAQVGCKLNGASTGSMLIDVAAVEAGGTSHTTTGTGHTARDILTTYDCNLLTGYK